MNTEHEFGWDDVIENDGAQVTLLPQGDYDFTVTGVERARHPGSEKLPPCNKAVLSLQIDAPQGPAFIRHHLFLHTKCEGLLCSFFTAIGQRRHGEPLRMDWDSIPGATGRCAVAVRGWTGGDGSERRTNEVRRFYKREEPQPFTQGDF